VIGYNNVFEVCNILGEADAPDQILFFPLGYETRPYVLIVLPDF
jgi:hypothetical protein